jgi:hypothetical protein
MRTIFKYNEWVCEIANGTINNIEQVWIVDSQEENQVIAKQWYKQKVIREKMFDCSELRAITLNEFLTVLSKYK